MIPINDIYILRLHYNNIILKRCEVGISWVYRLNTFRNENKKQIKKNKSKINHLLEGYENIHTEKSFYFPFDIESWN